VSSYFQKPNRQVSFIFLFILFLFLLGRMPFLIFPILILAVIWLWRKGRSLGGPFQDDPADWWKKGKPPFEDFQ